MLGSLHMGGIIYRDSCMLVLVLKEAGKIRREFPLLVLKARTPAWMLSDLWSFGSHP